MLPQAKPDRSSARASGRTTISAIAADQLAKGFVGRGIRLDRSHDILEGLARQDQPGRDHEVVRDLAQCREVVLKGIFDEARLGNAASTDKDLDLTSCLVGDVCGDLGAHCSTLVLYKIVESEH
jgi:hypothetical protein